MEINRGDSCLSLPSPRAGPESVPAESKNSEQLIHLKCTGIANMKVSGGGKQVNLMMQGCQKKEHLPFPRYREEKAVA